MPFNYKTEIERYKRYYQTIEDVASRPKTHAYTTAIFSFLAVSLFGWYAIRPTLQTILFLQREIADDKRVSQQMENKIGQLIQAQANLEAIQNQLPLLPRALPADPDTISVVSQIQRLALLTQASISAISVSSVPIIVPVSQGSITNKKVVDVPLSVTIGGTYPSLHTFINGIVSMERVVTIDALTVALDNEAGPSRGQAGGNPLRLVLKLKVHYIQP